MLVTRNPALILIFRTFIQSVVVSASSIKHGATRFYLYPSNEVPVFPWYFIFKFWTIENSIWISVLNLSVAIGQISIMEKVFHQRYNDGRLSTIERCYKERRLLTRIRRFQVCRGKLYQRGISNQREWQSALKWGQGKVQAGSTPSSHTAELPSPGLPGWPGPFPRWSISGSGRDSTVPIHWESRRCLA